MFLLLVGGKIHRILSIAEDILFDYKLTDRKLDFDQDIQNLLHKLFSLMAIPVLLEMTTL